MSMITIDVKCHIEIKSRIGLVIAEDTFSKRKELLRGKLDRNRKKRMIKTNAMECRAVWITDMSYEKKRYKKTRDIRNVDIKKNGKHQLN